jgi:ApaG protein
MPKPPTQYSFAIQVATLYLTEQSIPEQNQFAFSYTVTITNTGTVPAQLISRHWIIDDANGTRREVKGLGVVGHQPYMEPGQSFEYTSGTPLETTTGQMRGSFFFVAEDGERFDIAVPEFELVQQRTLH